MILVEAKHRGSKNIILPDQEHIVKMGPFMTARYCAKHNQHAKLGRSGGMPPRKFLKNRCSEIKSEVSE